MIVVDSSVWIAHLRNIENDAVRKLRRIDNPDDILIGDLILLEVLQGARDEGNAAGIERNLRYFRIETMLDAVSAPIVARNYRTLRGLGFTVRKTADLIIATFCIEKGHALLHDDRDFEPIEKHLGLRSL